jgi:hypothetical protein
MKKKSKDNFYILKRKRKKKLYYSHTSNPSPTHPGLPIILVLLLRVFSNYNMRIKS